MKNEKKKTKTASTLIWLVLSLSLASKCCRFRIEDDNGNGKDCKWPLFELQKSMCMHDARVCEKDFIFFLEPSINNRRIQTKKQNVKILAAQIDAAFSVQNKRHILMCECESTIAERMCGVKSTFFHKKFHTKMHRTDDDNVHMSDFKLNFAICRALRIEFNMEIIAV